MMKLIFKNVGQGDSIILKWKYKNKKFVGIIDANIYDKTNPVLEELKGMENFKVYFIIISHPHFDHFSGILEILDYLEQTKIPIKYFAHTLEFTRQYLQWNKLESEVNLLGRTIYKALELYNKKLIKNIGLLSQDWYTKLSDVYKLRILSPSDFEKRLFIKCFDEQNFDCRYNANLLSTIIQIFNSKKYFLLTSDSQSVSYKRLIERNFDDYFKNLVLTLTQVPHHGAEKSLYKEFWKSLVKIDNCPAVVSVGRNKYGHPSEEVLNFFRNLGFKVYRTDVKKKNSLNLISKNLSGQKELSFIFK